VAKKHFIKDKKGNVVKVLPWPFDEDTSDRPRDDSDDPTGGGGFSGGGGAPPPVLAPGEASWGFPTILQLSGAICWPGCISSPNTSWCFPNGTSEIQLRPSLFCCGCQNPNFGSYPPCAPCPKPPGSIGTSLIACEWDQGGWPFDTVTFKGRVYSKTPGQLEHCNNVGSLKIRWRTQASHYGANHVQPTATFSNLQTPTFTLQNGNGPYNGDAIDFEITHTGMHDAGYPHPPNNQGGIPDPAGNEHLILEGVFTDAEQLIEMTSVTYSNPQGNQTFSPFTPWWFYQGGNAGLMQWNPNLGNQTNGWISNLTTRVAANYTGTTNTVSFSTPCTALLASTFNSWPYGFRTDWEHNPNDPNKILSPANTLTYPFISGVLNTTTCVHDGMQPIALGAPATVQDLDNEATCNLSGAWPPNPNWYPHMQAKPDANIIHPNQSTFCEWAKDWINGGSVPNSFDQRAVAWGYTAQDLENLAGDCGCCDTLGVATAPNHDPAGNLLPIAGDSPSGLAPHLGVLADWIHP